MLVMVTSIYINRLTAKIFSDSPHASCFCLSTRKSSRWQFSLWFEGDITSSSAEGSTGLDIPRFLKQNQT